MMTMNPKEQLQNILNQQRKALSDELGDIQTPLDPTQISNYVQTQTKLQELITTGTFIDTPPLEQENEYEVLETDSNIDENKTPTQKALFKITIFGGKLIPDNGTAFNVSQSFIYQYCLEHDDSVEYHMENEEPVIDTVHRPEHPRSSRFKEVIVRVKYDGKYYADTDIDGDPLKDTFGFDRYDIVDAYAEGSQLNKDDLITLRYDATLDVPRPYCVWLERTSSPIKTVQHKPSPKKSKAKTLTPKHNPWAFDITGLKVAIIGGDMFHPAWKETLEEQGGLISCYEHSGKIKGTTATITRLIEQNDMVLLCQNMINHPAANAIRKQAKESSTPCESFEGFSVNQIFACIKTIQERQRG